MRLKPQLPPSPRVPKASPLPGRARRTACRAFGLAFAGLLAIASPPAAAFECPDYDAEIDRLRELESGATKGALNKEEIDCLETAYAKSEQQTKKNKISRVLLVNAYAYSTKEWARLMERHLAEVDQSDPDLAYLWAIYKHNNGAEAHADEVVKWTETALERRDVWSGDLYVGRVYGLMKLRSLASSIVWKASEAKFAAGDDSIDTDAIRNGVKTYAREWVDFAKVSGRDPTEALELCLSAASAKACGDE